MTPNNHRWEKLADYFEQTMQDAKASKRVRLTAAQRLFELLERRDKRHASEARHAERTRLEATKREEQALQRGIEAQLPEDPVEAQLQRLARCLPTLPRKSDRGNRLRIVLAFVLTRKNNCGNIREMKG